jgi:type III restriction enzyme
MDKRNQRNSTAYLETYWYLRLVEGTPRVVDLYRKLFPKQSELLGALGLVHEDIRTCALDYGVEELLKRVETDNEFVRQYRLETLRETLVLDYPSYILALAMGAG